MRQFFIAVFVTFLAFALACAVLAEVRPEFALYWSKLSIIGAVCACLVFPVLLKPKTRSERFWGQTEARRTLRRNLRIAMLANPLRRR